METGHFYFLSEQYFIDFPDPLLMSNHEAINGEFHDRPCFYAFKDEATELYWMIPCSSKTEKYHKIYDKKVAKYGRCDTILFGAISGYEKAFLLQNMCPVIPKYIKNEYVDSATSIPIRVDGRFEMKLTATARRVLFLQRQGRNLIFPNVLQIESKLLSFAE